MEIIIGLETNLDTERNALIYDFSDKINEFFKPQKFSELVNEIAIRIICVRPEYDFIFVPKKMRFMKANSKLDHGVQISYGNHIAVDIKYNHLELHEMEPNEFLRIIKSEVIKTLVTIDKFKKSIPDFRFDDFKVALCRF
jgi:hypothetical protein